MGVDGRRGRGPGNRYVTVVVLAGGTGGAKLARGMLDLVGDELVVVANTGDDVEIYGAYVSPDPDLCAFWLADRIDERGWGLRDDTFNVMDGMRELGVDVWFNLGDRDLAVGLRRARAPRWRHAAHGDARRAHALARARRTRAADVRRPRPHLGARARGLGAVPGVHDPPAREGPRRRRGAARRRGREGVAGGARGDRVRAGRRGGTVEPGHLDRPDPGRARHPRRAPRDRRTGRGRVAARGRRGAQGSDADFIAWTGQPATAAGVAELLGDVLDGMVCDERRAGPLPVLRTDTLMADAEGRRRVAGAALTFAEALAS